MALLKGFSLLNILISDRSAHPCLSRCLVARPTLTSFGHPNEVSVGRATRHLLRHGCALRSEIKMLRRENPFRRAMAHRVYTAAFLCSLSLGVALLPLVSAAQGPTEEAPVIDPKTGAVTIVGYTLTPGNVDTEGWLEQNKSVLVNFSLDRSEE